jgi:hypothetical protein
VNEDVVNNKQERDREKERAMKDERDPNNLTPEERALVESGAEPDLPSGMPPLAALLQRMSITTGAPALRHFAGSVVPKV